MTPQLCATFLALLVVVLCPAALDAQFLEDFVAPTKGFAAQGLPGWNSFPGDGDVVFEQRIADGAATLRVDARRDQRNIWYALTHTDVSRSIDFAALKRPDRELRIEARVRPSHAPRRCNLYLAHESGANWLREFDLPTTDWHVVSMTTEGWDAVDAARLLGQVSMMDWGVDDVFTLEVDYLRVDVVDSGAVEPDSPLKVRYRPPLAPAASFNKTLRATHSYTVDRDHPERSLGAWSKITGTGAVPVVSVDGAKLVLLRWDFDELAGKRVVGEGQFEITAVDLYRLADSPKDFGEIRVCEVLEGASIDQAADGYAAFVGQAAERDLINQQTIVDTPVNPSGPTTVTLSEPVLRRLVSGQSKGIAIKPLGMINATFHAADSDHAPLLRLNLE